MITLEASSLQISFVAWCSDQPFLFVVQDFALL
jgi:hypothetical protein